MNKRTENTLVAPVIVAPVTPSGISSPAMEQHQGRTRALWSACAGGICLVALLILVRAFSTDLHIPFSYGGDTFYFLSVVRGLIDNQSWLYNSELNFPFGADMRDFPQSMTVDYSALWVLGKLIQSPSLLLNLYWMGIVTLTASLATYSFLRLGLDRRVAVVVGVLYALQPYTFFRNIVHFNLIFYCVPVLAGFMVEQIGREKHDARERMPAMVIVFAIIQGLSYIYNTFFTAFFLVTTAGIILLRTRSWRATRPVMLVSVLLVGCAAVNLAPSFVLWGTQGKNPNLSYKNPGQAETFGLKIRHLLTPIENHPLGILRGIQKRYDSASYPLENENRGSRLGALGSGGFVFLMGYALWRLNAPKSLDKRLDAACALTLGGLGLATIGGLGSIFNVFVAPDVRCYNRIVTFLSYFALLAAGVLFTAALKRWASTGSRIRIGVFALAVILVLGILDQASWSAFQQPLTGVNSFDQRRQLYANETVFVKTVQARLGSRAALFNLPLSNFPVDSNLYVYAHAMPYIWGGFRESWGAVTGRGSEWVQQLSSQPIDKMLPQLAMAGYDGVWIDVRNYPGGVTQSPIPALRATPGLTEMVSRDGSYYVFDIRSRRDTRIVHSPLNIQWNGAFYGEEKDREHTWHWCGSSGTVRLTNPDPTQRHVKLSMLLHGSGDIAQRVRISGPGFKEERPLSQEELRFECDISLPAGGQTALEFHVNGQPMKVPGDARLIFFGISDFQFTDR